MTEKLREKIAKILYHHFDEVDPHGLVGIVDLPIEIMVDPCGETANWFASQILLACKESELVQLDDLERQHIMVALKNAYEDEWCSICEDIEDKLKLQKSKGD